MYVKTLYVEDETLLIFRQTGLSTYVKQLAYGKWLSGQPFGDLPTRVLVDLTGLTDTTLTTQEIYWQSKRMERVAVENGLRRKVAFVITSDLGFGMVRIYQGFCASGDVIEIEPFYANDEALIWLGARAANADYDARDGWQDTHFEDPDAA